MLSKDLRLIKRRQERGWQGKDLEKKGHISEQEKKLNKKKGLFEISTKEILLPQIYYGYNVITF